MIQPIHGGRSLAIEVGRPDAEARIRDLFLALVTSLWLAYTALFPTFSAAHRTLPLCPFLVLTGLPCPLCGGTRSFAAMWGGDVGRAARLHPLVPLLFPLTLAVCAYALWAVLSARSIRINLSARAQRWVTVIGVCALAASWSAKLLWLGN